MAIQIIPANPKKSTGEILGEALGNFARSGAEAYQQHQRQKQFAQALQGLEDIYGNPELNEQQKLIETYRRMGQFPEAAQQLSGGLSRISGQKSRSEEFAAKMKREEEDKKAMFQFGEKLRKDNPNNPLYNTLADIYTSNLSPDVASSMVRDITGVDPFKVQQQRRLQLDSVLKRYSQRLKELEDEIGKVINPNSTGKEEVTSLKNQRNALRAERDELLGFKALMDEEDGVESEDEDMEFEDEGPKVAFDPNNKKHRAVAEKLYKKHKDKEKVRQILKKQFKGL